MEKNNLQSVFKRIIKRIQENEEVTQVSKSNFYTLCTLCFFLLNRYRQSVLVRFISDKIRMTGKTSFAREGNLVFMLKSKSFSSPFAARLFDALFQRTLI